MRNLFFFVLLFFSSVVYAVDCPVKPTCNDGGLSSKGGAYCANGTDGWGNTQNNIIFGADNVPIGFPSVTHCTVPASEANSCLAENKAYTDAVAAGCVKPPLPDCPAGQHRSTATVGDTIDKCLPNDPPKSCGDNEYWKVAENRCVSGGTDVHACADESLTYCPISKSCIPTEIPCTDDPNHPPPVKCADGSFKPDGQCSIQLCSDGSIKPSSGSCPTPVMCADGSIKQIDTGCPKSVVCGDGSIKPSSSSCPPSAPVDDSATKALQAQKDAEAKKAIDDAIKAADTAKRDAASKIAAANDAVSQAQQNYDNAVTEHNNNPSPSSAGTLTISKLELDRAKTALDSALADSSASDMSGVEARLDGIKSSMDKLNDAGKGSQAVDGGDGAGTHPELPANKTERYYTKSTKTINEVLSDGVDDLKQKQVITTFKDVFSIDSYSCSCPIWRLDDLMGFKTSFAIDVFCTNVANMAFAIAKSVLQVLATFLAIRIGMGGWK